MTNTPSLRPHSRRNWLAHPLAVFFLLKDANAFLSERRPFLSSTTAVRRSGVNYPARRPPAAADRSPSISATALGSGMWNQDDEIQGADRIKACVPYLLPLIDGDHFGRFIYERITPLGAVNEVTIGPLAELVHKIPFLSLGLFVALTLGTRFNTEMSRNLRFSAQQAALIDVALLLPELLGSGFEDDPLPRYIAEPCSNFVWYAYMSTIVYCVYSNLRGKKPDQIPFLSNSADLLVGPF